MYLINWFASNEEYRYSFNLTIYFLKLIILIDILSLYILFALQYNFLLNY